MTPVQSTRPKRRRLIAALALLPAAAFLLFAYMTSEALGIFGGLWWKTERATWTVDHPGATLLVGVHPTGQTRPLSLTIRNSGTLPLVWPFAVAGGPSPWLPFDRQAQSAVVGAAGDADRAARLVEWVRTLVQPETRGAKAQHLDPQPWAMTRALGFGDCDDLSYLVFLAAQANGMRARVLELPGHAVAEIEYGGAWHVFDPTYGFALYDDDGRVPSYDQVAAAGGLPAWAKKQRPWLFARLTAGVWDGPANEVPRDIPPGWQNPPPAFALNPGDSWTLTRLRHRELFAWQDDGKDAWIARVDLDLDLPPREIDLTFPFPLRKVTAVHGDGEAPLVLLDVADKPTELTYRLSAVMPSGWPEDSRLHIEGFAAASWLPVPQPGLTALEVGWDSGDRLELTLAWQRR